MNRYRLLSPDPGTYAASYKTLQKDFMQSCSRWFNAGDGNEYKQLPQTRDRAGSVTRKLGFLMG